MATTSRFFCVSKLFSRNANFQTHLSNRSHFPNSCSSSSSSPFSSSAPTSLSSPCSLSTSTGFLSNGQTTTLTRNNLFSTSTSALKKAKDISVNFKHADGSVDTVMGAEGDSLLDLVVDNNIDIDGFGACEGTLACSTCHVVLSQEDYDRIPDQPTDEEYDMLDLAYGLTDTSRLGCQIFLTKDLDKLVVDIPPGIADARSWFSSIRRIKACVIARR